MAQALHLWRPEVHERFQETLLFYLLRVNPFTEHEFFRELEKFLSDNRLSGYCAYCIYGSTDVLLRVWLPLGQEAGFKPNLQRSVKWIKDATPFRVTSIHQHWCWPTQDAQSPSASLDDVTIDRIEEVQSRSASAVQRAIDEGLMKVVEKSSRIKFLTSVILPQGIGAEAHDMLLSRIGTKLQLREENGTLCRSSVYVGYGFASILIKSETEDFFSIWSLIEELNGDLVLLEGSTLTHWVATREPVESDDISEAALAAMQTVDLSVNAIVPQLYETTSLTSDERRAIEDWVRTHVISHSLTSDQRAAVRQCLVGVIESSEALIIAAIIEAFSRAESYLRSKRGHFISKALGPRAEPDVLRAARIDTHKSTKFLNLGELLNIYSHVLKKAEITEDQRLTADWQRAVELRNRVAHGEIAPLQEWKNSLAVFVDFLVRYGELVVIVDER